MHSMPDAYILHDTFFCNLCLQMHRNIVFWLFSKHFPASSYWCTDRGNQCFQLYIWVGLCTLQNQKIFGWDFESGRFYYSIYFPFRSPLADNAHMYTWRIKYECLKHVQLVTINLSMHGDLKEVIGIVIVTNCVVYFRSVRDLIIKSTFASKRS